MVTKTDDNQNDAEPEEIVDVDQESEEYKAWKGETTPIEEIPKGKTTPVEEIPKGETKDAQPKKENNG